MKIPQKLRIICSATFLALVLLVTTSLPALAIANPASISFDSTRGVKVFQNIFETGDTLFVVKYDIAYTTTPDEPASSTFQIAVYNTAGTTEIRHAGVTDYQVNIASIYFSAAQTTSSLVWGSDYYVKVMGSPMYFSTLTEDVNMDTTQLSSGHWAAGAMTASRNLLYGHCELLAISLEDAWGVPLLVYTPEGYVLNSTGRAAFLAAIPGLDAVVPTLFQSATVPIEITWEAAGVGYQPELTIQAQLGTQIKNAFDGIGNMLGISGQSAATIWIGIFALTIASIIFLNSGNTTASLILMMPIFMLGAWVGAIQLAALFVVSIGIIVFVGYYIWLRGM